mmetsp:Transcript_18574/g.25658  ORF Transcript_18574/g.25658 Transcript_18574/m.25658 type:complete len:299 (-) Transcript_18574:834-1730(-)|eukprot:CAMPEP_0201093184 /NCGR_PEP_ID=MMETSP0812-20130820/1742_1 /ASSEMBLY_ACC=CAM_ASM_000668 /TAXON_ID=98059 /ORGANISM="Dinobryon sp., Strain UTEXLB2267" /LENGTH=298 /DNA_ID=CAMNT_0047345241 /DNA_START=76 /DNA_END=972 /DNA_ORIENTATION=+
MSSGPSLSHSLGKFDETGVVHNAHSDLPMGRGISSLMDMISKDGKPATYGSTNMIVIPKSLSEDQNSSAQLFPLVQQLSSFTAAAAAASVKRQYPNIDISETNGKFEGTNAMACALYNNFTQGLSGYYYYETQRAYEHTITKSSVSFHSQLLDILFKSLAFPENVVIKLDAILTQLNNNLTDFSTSKISDGDRLAHMINLTSCEKNDFGVYVATSYFFLVSMDMSSLHSVWKSGKADQESQSYSFKFSYLLTKAVMNGFMVGRDFDKISAYTDQMLGAQGTAEFNKAVSPSALIDESK